jgi:hypothetical protein
LKEERQQALEKIDSISLFFFVFIFWREKEVETISS